MPSRLLPKDFGSGELRLTVWQNLLIPNIPSDQLKPALAAIRAAGLDCTAGTVSERNRSLHRKSRLPLCRL